MNTFKMLYNKKKENETNEQRENGWDSRFNMPIKPSNSAINNQLKIVHNNESHNYQHFLSNMKKNESKPKTREKSSINTNKTPNVKNRTNNFSGKNLVHRDNNFNSNIKNNIYIKKYDSKEGSNNQNDLYVEEKFLQIRQLWDETGVTENFQIVFENMTIQLDNSFRSAYFDYEIDSLNSFKEKLTRLCNEITAREKNIELLQKFEKVLSQKKKFDKNEIQDLIRAIKNMRVLSVNIVNHFNKLRIISSNDFLNGKYDIDRISMSPIRPNKISNHTGSNAEINFQFFNFDKNYLIKMKNDLDFLHTSALSKYFNFASNSDPFLLALNENIHSTIDHVDNPSMDMKNYNGIQKPAKIKVPIEESMMGTIKNCQYSILKELIYKEMNHNNYNYTKNQNTLVNKNNSISVPSRKNSVLKKKNELKPLNISYGKNISPKNVDFLSNKNYNANHEMSNFFKNEKIDNGISNIGNNNYDLMFSNEKNYIGKNVYNFDSILNESKATKKSEISIKEKDLKKIEKIMSKHKNKEKLQMENFHEMLKDDFLQENYYYSRDFNNFNDQNKITNLIEKKEYNIHEDIPNEAHYFSKNNTQALTKYNNRVRNEKLTIDDSKTVIGHSKVVVDMNKTESQLKESEYSKEPIDASNKLKTEDLIKKLDNALKISTSLQDSKIKEFEMLEQVDTVRIEGDVDINTVAIKDDQFKNAENNTTQHILHQSTNIMDNNQTPLENSEIKFDLNLISFKFYNKNLEQLQSIYQNYLGNVCAEQKIVFKIQEDIYFYLQGNFTKVVEILYGDHLLSGISFLHFDPNSDHKLIISNFSTIYYEFYYEIFDKFINFLRFNMSFKEIYLELYYGYRNEAFYLNQYINDIIKNKIKFKWITLENTGTERKTKYRLTNNLENESSSDLCDLFTCKNSVALSIEDYNDSYPLTEDYDINFFLITCIIGDMMYNFDYIIKNEQFRKLNTEKLHQIRSNFVMCTGTNLNGTKDFFKNLNSDDKNSEVNFDVPDEFSSENFIFSSIMNFSNKFDNLSSTVIEEVLYNKITLDKIDILLHPSTSKHYYLLRPLDEKYSIMVGEYDEELTKDIYSVFIDIYSKLDQNPIGSKNSIYIPSFNVVKKSFIPYPQLMSNIEITEDNTNYRVSKLFYSNKITFDFDKTVKNHKNHSDYLFSMPINNETDVIINKRFIIAVINLEVFTELNIPCISVTLVDENNFTRVDSCL